MKVIFKCILTLFILLSSSDGYASQVAVVAVKRAVIWADMEQTSPLGHVKRGKKLLVGSVPRKHGTVLPVVVSGRIAWIKISDISMKNRKNRSRQIVEHHVEDAMDKVDFDLWKENNSLLFHYKFFDTSDESLNAMEAAGDVNISTIALGILAEHRYPLKNHAFGIGLDYYNIQGETITYKTFAISGQVSWIPFKFDNYSFEAFFGGSLSGDFRVNVNGHNYDRGLMYGFKVGAIARFFTQSKYQVYLGSSLEKNTISSVKNAYTGDGNDTVDVNSVDGINWLFIGVAVKI